VSGDTEICCLYSKLRTSSRWAKAGPPVVRSGAYAEAFGFQNLCLKLDYLDPTGSFKDRGSTVLISKARELGVKSVVDDSSGSAGSSVAAYSARSGMTCSINVPDGVRSGKTVQMGMYGASVIRVDGPRGSVVKAAQEACETEGGILRVAWRQCLLLRGHQDGRL
jgi:threonine synthase